MAERPTRMNAAAALAWRHALVLALGFGGLATAPSDASAAVFGSDDRRPLTVRSDQVSSDGVGRLASAASGRFCTAFCVADTIIATAAHCLVGTDAGDAPNPDELTFSLQADAGNASAASPSSGLAGRTTRTATLNIISGLRQLKTRAPMNAAKDWAVAKLETPICKGRALNLAQTEQTDPPAAAPPGDIRDIAPAAFAAWHADTQRSALHVQSDCKPIANFTSDVRSAMARDFANRQHLRVHGCDTGPGASGAPLFVSRNRRPVVAAINTGTYTLVGTEPSEAGHGSTPTSTAIANTAVSITPLRAAMAALSQRTILISRGDLEKLRHMLNALGYDTRATSDTSVTPADDGLVSAVARFERDRRRRPTGLIDDTLLRDVADVLASMTAARTIPMTRARR